MQDNRGIGKEVGTVHSASRGRKFGKWKEKLEKSRVWKQPMFINALGQVRKKEGR